MRKFLMITVLAGAGALGLGAPAPAEAAPHGFAIAPAVQASAVQAQEGVQARVEEVQYRRHHRRPPHRRYHRRGRY